MKKYLLICCVLFSSIINGQKKSYISISFISAFPVGDFAKSETNYISNILGYAKKGFGGDLTYVHRSNKTNFGFAASIRFRQNKIDTATVLIEKPSPYNAYIPPFTWEKKEVNWQLKAVMIGGYYGKSISPKLTVNAKILSGVANATLPAINWLGTAKTPYTGYGEFKRDEAPSICISTCLATGFELLSQKNFHC